MKPILKHTALAFALGFIPLLAQAPAASDPPAPQTLPSTGPKAERAAQRWAETLQLSDEQKAKIQAIRGKHAEEMKQGRKTAQEARKAFHQAMGNPDTPADTLRTLHRTMSDHAFALLLARRTMHQEVRAVLTPEQREKAAYLHGRRLGALKTRLGRAER